MSQSFPSPETITRRELPNGIAILAYENASSPAVVLGGYLWAGALSDPPGLAGLANFTAGMLLRGTEARTFAEINTALESVGAQLGFQSAMHSISFGGKALAEDLDLLLGMLVDSLQHPTFPADEAEQLRGQILTDLDRRAHDTRRMARLTFDALLYPDHPYGRSVQGYKETVTAIDRASLVQHYENHYSPQGMVLAVVGAVAAEAAADRVAAALGGWQAPQAAPERTIPARVRLSEPRRQSVRVEGKTQSDIVLGWPGLARTDPEYLKAYLANTVLGVFGLMGRLGDTVREEQGLAYYVHSWLEAGAGAGPWVTTAGVDPANVEQAIEGILHEVRRLREEPVPLAELADSQLFLTGSMPLRLETNEGIAGTLLEMERYDLGLDYLERYSGLVNAVTVQDVLEMARAYLDPEVYALAVAGPG